MNEPWLIDGAVKDAQSITAHWTPTELRLIDGVFVREVLHVPKSQGYLTEIVRAEWLGENARIDQVFQVTLFPHGLSAWHAHAETTDRLFVTQGLVRVVLYDARPSSPTHGVVNEFRFGTIRPALVSVPPRVWHGVQNLTDRDAMVLNLVDRAYAYEDPDHWRLPPDSKEIPFAF